MGKNIRARKSCVKSVNDPNGHLGQLQDYDRQFGNRLKMPKYKTQRDDNQEKHQGRPGKKVVSRLFQ